MNYPFRLEQLNDLHDRMAFSCGEESLDRYIRTQATQDIRRRVASCFVAVKAATEGLGGWYTIASASIPTPDLPAEITKRLPRYSTLPAVRIGRLAVDLRFRGRGLGSALLADAVERTLKAPPATYTLLVDAIDEKAAAFYRHHGFQPLTGKPLTLFLPLATAEKCLVRPGR